MLRIVHDRLTAEEFITLWSSVWDGAPSIEQAELAMKNSLFRVTVFDGDKPVAMARMIGDLGLCCYIKDVIVLPGYQGKGIGRILMEELIGFVRSHGVPGTAVSAELCAMPDKMPFYAKFGFSANEAQRMRLFIKAK
ncbi:MAG: GNAT family N-acetyltransferase [Ruminococcus sp.]|nr:GNAT family N-acetyltransferase [Ruminococcus sp.]